MTREEITKDIERIKESAMKSPDKDKYACPICKDKRGFLYDLNGYETWIKCECDERQKSIERLNKSGISEEYRSKRLKDYNTFGEKQLEEAKDIVKDYMVSFSDLNGKRSSSLLLSGRSGSGKTMLGVIASMYIIGKQNTGVRYVSYRDMIMNLKQNIMDEHKYNLELGNIMHESVLFIDDLFKGKVTDSDINIMYTIINYRYLASKPLIISTELSPEKLLEIDEAIGSRIIEMSKGHIVTFDANVQNYRMR